VFHHVITGAKLTIIFDTEAKLNNRNVIFLIVVCSVPLTEIEAAAPG
jgi:hypothetical protein